MVRWSPWDALRLAGRRVEFRRARLPDRFGGGVMVPQGSWAAVVVDDRLLGPERRVTLGHELLHVERGGGPAYTGQPRTWDDLVARDERQVDAELARRMVPFDELRALEESGETFTADDLADHFNVTPDVIEAAVELYRRA